MAMVIIGAYQPGEPKSSASPGSHFVRRAGMHLHYHMLKEEGKKIKGEDDDNESMTPVLDSLRLYMGLMETRSVPKAKLAA
jgi:hypothetical protein